MTFDEMMSLLIEQPKAYVGYIKDKEFFTLSDDLAHINTYPRNSRANLNKIHYFSKDWKIMATDEANKLLGTSGVRNREEDIRMLATQIEEMRNQVFRAREQRPQQEQSNYRLTSDGDEGGF